MELWGLLKIGGVLGSISGVLLFLWRYGAWQYKRGMADGEKKKLKEIIKSDAKMVRAVLAFFDDPNSLFKLRNLKSSKD